MCVWLAVCWMWLGCCQYQFVECGCVAKSGFVTYSGSLQKVALLLYVAACRLRLCYYMRCFECSCVAVALLLSLLLTGCVGECGYVAEWAVLLNVALLLLWLAECWVGYVAECGCVVFGGCVVSCQLCRCTWLCYWMWLHCCVWLYYWMWLSVLLSVAACVTRRWLSHASWRWSAPRLERRSSWAETSSATSWPKWRQCDTSADLVGEPSSLIEAAH